MNGFNLRFPPTAKLNDKQYFQLCQANRELRFERTVQGELLIMSPTGGETGRQNTEIVTELATWNRQTQLGIAFGSSTGFKLPNGADRSPDAAWIPIEPWNRLTSQQKARFLPLCPNFVIELRSPSDTLAPLQS